MATLEKKSTHPGEKSTKSTPAHQKKKQDTEKSTKKHYALKALTTIPEHEFDSAKTRPTSESHVRTLKAWTNKWRTANTCKVHMYLFWHEIRWFSSVGGTRFDLHYSAIATTPKLWRNVLDQLFWGNIFVLWKGESYSQGHRTPFVGGHTTLFRQDLIFYPH